MTAATGRLRLDRSGRSGAGTAAGAPAAHAVAAGPAITRIEDPAFWIVVVPDYEAGRLSSHDRDVFGAARKLADRDGGGVVAVVFEPGEDPGPAGADRLIRFDDPGYVGYAPAHRATAIEALIAELAPRHLLFADTLVAGGDIGRRVAAARHVTPATRVHRLRVDEVVSRGDGARSDYTRTPPRVLLLAPECEDPIAPDRCHEARPVAPPAVDIGDGDGGIRDLGLLPIDPGAVPLAEADFVLSAGNGVTDWDAFHALARALGAAEGGSRVVCDAGLMPRERQIGASGTLIEARCYLAFGISGAPQHLQGIARCEKVVAVNTDLHAEMVKRGDLSAIKDAQEVMPALTRLLEAQARDT
ncbi:electron transfer flavoprotein subunit alpha/FixB family protein [Salinisphaera sp. Q1T1-3]|uniref:electron transfer flavoprotein subunit alpha/FixB family protein n=1 Tax=Salinisphaera sp. Q1T1-3 TaxID=2321229 RepID=UPI001314290A|nr:electron transfer flavoprotein subunit alpha/FixB family protein [Salinisphaera sp. Q1T1-3]